MSNASKSVHQNISKSTAQLRFATAAVYSSLLLTLCSASTVFAAQTQNANSGTLWDVLIVVIVFAVTAASAVLPFAAIRQWDRNWGFVAAFPFLLLLLWSGIILLAKYRDPDSHQLWTLEIFAWAMINMIYMVTVMTAKRMFAKRDAEQVLSQDQNPS